MAAPRPPWIDMSSPARPMPANTIEAAKPMESPTTISWITARPSSRSAGVAPNRGPSGQGHGERQARSHPQRDARVSEEGRQREGAQQAHHHQDGAEHVVEPEGEAH